MFEHIKADFDSIFYLKMLKSHKISVAHMHMQLLIQKLKVLLKSLFLNISYSVGDHSSHFVHTLKMNEY